MSETAKKEAAPAAAAKPKLSRKTVRKAGRAKKVAKLKTDKEFAKTYFEAKSKRSVDKKAAFRKKKKNKK